MTHLRKMMLEELQRRNYSEITTRKYLQYVTAFARHFGKSPDQLGPNELRSYQAYLLQERKVTPGTAVNCVAALRFFFNRVRAEIVEDGVKVWLSEENAPYVQLKKYNTTLGDQPREYAPLPPAIAASIGVHKMIAHHLHYLPLSAVGARYLVNVHLIRFTATPGRPCDTSPPGLHKDGEKYIATHLLGCCGARGGAVIITDNDKLEMDRFTMRECGECYVFDDDRIWHMLTPVAVLEGNHYAYRDTLAFDMLPEGWEPVK